MVGPFSSRLGVFAENLFVANTPVLLKGWVPAKAQRRKESIRMTS